MVRTLAALMLATAIAVTAHAQPARESRPAQLEAQKELIGKVLNYQYADSADLRVLIHADGISWEGVGGPLNGMRSRSSGLRLSKIAAGIYFATWLTQAGGEDSIVFNFNDMTVFAHVFNPRRDSTFQLDGVIKCYGDEDKCVAPDTTPMSDEERQAIGRRNRPRPADAPMAGKTTSDAEIMQLLRKYEQSVNDMDLELAEEIWSQDSAVSFIHPRGHEKGWPDIKRKFYQETMGRLPKRHLQLRDIEIYQLTEDSAWAEFYWDFDATRPNGALIKSAGRETQVFKRENGAWQIQNVHYSGMPTQKEGEGF